MKNNIKLKRFLAYLIDILIIVSLIYLISQIKLFNFNNEKYLKAYESYNEYLKNMSNTTSIKDVANSEYIGILHDLQYYSLPATFTQIIIIILYYSLFPYFFDGQTVGKKIFHLKITSLKDEKIKFKDYVLRSFFYPIWSNIIFYTALSNLLLALVALLFKGNLFYYLNLTISSLFTIYAYVDIIKYINSNDGIAIHDRISKTKVVEVNGGN